MPAFGSSAVPLPTKNRTTLPGCQPTAAPNPDTPAAAPTNGLTGALMLVVVAATAARPVEDPPPDSRRTAANSVNTNGATTGESPDLPPAPSHPATPAPTPST